MKQAHIWLLTLILLMMGCKGSKSTLVTEEETSTSITAGSCFISSKLQLTIPKNNGSITLSGNMKMIANNMTRFSILMPLVRTEIARIEVSANNILIIDRVNHRYITATRAEINNIFSKNVEYTQLESLIQQAAQTGNTTLLEGDKLGLPSLEKANVKLYGFSNKEFSMSPTELSSKYEQIPLNEAIALLTGLL